MTVNENPESNGSLLEPEEKGISDFILPGILGAVGIALVYRSFSKKKKSGSKSERLEVREDEVKFSNNYWTYSVGKNWESQIFEPFLAEQAEEGNLATYNFIEDSIVAGAIEPMMKESRLRVLSSFRETHKVSTIDGEIFISKLPGGKPGVQKFNEWLDEIAKKFQEEY